MSGTIRGASNSAPYVVKRASADAYLANLGRKVGRVGGVGGVQDE